MKPILIRQISPVFLLVCLMFLACGSRQEHGHDHDHGEPGIVDPNEIAGNPIEVYLGLRELLFAELTPEEYFEFDFQTNDIRKTIDAQIVSGEFGFALEKLEANRTLMGEESYYLLRTKHAYYSNDTSTLFQQLLPGENVEESRLLLANWNLLGKLGYKVPVEKQNEILGVVVEFATPELMTSIAGYADGTSRMFTSNGGGLIGHGDQVFMAEAARGLVKSATLYRGICPPCNERVPATHDGQTRIYLLASGKRYCGLVGKDRFENGEGTMPGLGASFARLYAVLGSMYAYQSNPNSPAGPLDVLFGGHVLAEEFVQADELLKVGANPDAPAVEGTPLLVMAAAKDQITALKYLAARGANLNAKTYEDGYTALMMPVSEGNTATAELLLDLGVDLEARKKGEGTALMVAALEGGPEMVQLLIDRGAKLDAIDQFGQTALMYACNAQNLASVQLLVEAGGAVNAVDQDNNSALLYAAQHGNFPIIQYLLSKEADPNVKGTDGMTAFDVAKNNGHFEAAAELKRWM